MTLDENATTIIISFLVTVAGTGIGVYLAFLGDSFREKRSERKETRRVLNLLKYELEDNLVIMNLIRGSLKRDALPFEHVSFSIYQGISNRIELLTDDTLLKCVQSAYHHFVIFENAIRDFRNDQITAAIQPDGPVKAKFVGIVFDQQKAIVDHLTPSENGVDMVSITKKAIAALDTAIKASEKKRTWVFLEHAARDLLFLVVGGMVAVVLSWALVLPFIEYMIALTAVILLGLGSLAFCYYVIDRKTVKPPVSPS
jgi:hypothetical protein